MASVDSLPPDQRAVLSLVLTRGRSYDEIAEMLAIDRAGARGRALAAFDALGPASGVSEPERALITDYLLGQLPASLAAETRGRLEETAAGRAWASAIAGELEPIAGGALPEIPRGAVATPTPTTRVTRTEITTSSPEAPRPRPSSRRGGAILLGALGAIVLIVIVVVAVGGLGTSSSPGSSTSAGSSTRNSGDVSSTSSSSRTATSTAGTAPVSSSVKIIGHAILLPPTTDAAHHAAGVAEIVRDGSRLGVVIAAQGLTANTNRNAYAVWLTNSAGDNDFIGFVSHLVGADGKLTADGALPADVSRYTEILLTLETEQTPAAPGPVALEGALSLPR